MRFLLTLIAGLLAPSLFAANLSFLAPTNDVLPTNLNKLYVTSSVARATATAGTNVPRATLTTHGDFIVRSPMDGSQMYWSTSNARLEVTIGNFSGGSGVAVRSDGSVAIASTNFLTRNGILMTQPGTNDFQFGNNATHVLLTTNGHLRPNLGQPHDLGGPDHYWSNYFGINGYFSDRVGIGTNAPVEALHVHGNIKGASNITSQSYTASGDGSASTVPLIITGPAASVSDQFQIKTNNGTVQVAVSSNGVLRLMGSVGVRTLQFGTDASGWARAGDQSWDWFGFGSIVANIGGNGADFTAASGGLFGFASASSGATVRTTRDTAIYRATAGNIGVTNGLRIPLAGGLGIGNGGVVISNILTGTASLDFSAQTAGATPEDLPITVAGAADGDVVELAIPVIATTNIIGNYNWFASNGVVFVRFVSTGTAQNPSGGTFRALVKKLQ